MNYQETLAYLFRRLPMFQRVGVQAFKKDLGNIKQLMNFLNHPHNNYATIHIAGTNGKGSVTHILAKMLMEAGLKVGFYTSPHYRDFRERIKINGQLMPKRKVTTFVKKYKEQIEQVNASFFEVTVAMAFDYFAYEQVDVAIIETGLGGRLDSTNIITPILSIITNISLDHQAMLGDTLPQIAMEKAGIIKKGIPVVIGEKQAQTLPIFRRKAEAMKAPLFLAEKITKLEVRQNDMTGIKGYFTIAGKSFDLETDISGPFQEKNLKTAITAYQHLLKPLALPALSAKSFQNIQKRTNFIGRWTILGKNPLILADSAHNIAGLTLFAQAIQNIPHQKMYIILGTVNDKNPSYLFDILPKNAFYHFAKANIPRGLDAQKLLEIATKKGIKAQAYSSVRRALAAAKRKAQPKDLIIIAGSIFVVAEVV